MQIKRYYQASYTVEATYIMAITFLALSVLIRTAYMQYEKETGIMRLHHIVEQLRGQEKEENRSLSLGRWRLQAARYEEEAEGSLEGDHGGREISTKIHDPENMMRKMIILQP